MTMIDDDKIRARAYEIWEREGRPEGRERDHWQQAHRELMGETGEAPTDDAKAHSEAPAVRRTSRRNTLGKAERGEAAPADNAAPEAAPPRKISEKRGGRGAGKTAASIPEPPPTTRPIRKSSARRGDEAITTPATAGDLKRSVKKPQT